MAGAGTKLAKAQGRGMLLGCAVYAVAAVLAGGSFFVCMGLPVVLPSDLAPIGMILGLTGWVTLVFGGLAVLGPSIVIRRNHQLDRALAAYGPGHAAAVVMRGWASEVDGRELNVWFSKGPALDLYLTCDAGTRVSFGQDNMLYRASARTLGREALPMDDGVLATGAEAEWTGQLVADAGVREAIGVLLEEDGRTLKVLNVTPDYLLLQQRHLAMSTISPENLERWVAAMVTVARTIDAMPPPQERLTNSALLGRMRTNRGSVGKLLAITVTLTMVMMLGSVAFTMLILAVVLATSS